MSQAEIVAHWQKGAHDALRAAQLLLKENSYELTLFHCHLAVEKALKAAFLLEQNSDPPPTHDLLSLAMRLKRNWNDEEKTMFNSLTDYAVSARYSDPTWAEAEATKENAALWLEKSTTFLSELLPPL